MAEDKKCLPLVFLLMLTVLFLLVQCTCFCSAAERSSSGHNQGNWQLLLNNTGVVAMHMALTHHDTVIILDQMGAGQAGYRLQRRFNGTRCTGSNLRDPSCYAHSVEYDIYGNKIRPLRLETDPFCSSGSFLSNGTLLQTGGNGEGARRMRYFRPCPSGQLCDWRQSKTLLSDNRWYATHQILPEKDRVIVVGGRRAFTYEFVPKLSSEDKSHNLPFLHNNNHRNVGGNNFYPFLHLSSDGNLFIFANRESILFNYRQNRVVKTFPRIPGDGQRTYPSTGSSVILPLDHTDGFKKVEVMICGGAAPGAQRAARRKREFLKGLSSCGRMVITGNVHEWSMENMPGPRLLHDMLILPTGNVLIINGAERGCAGWNNAADPSLHPYLYKPDKARGRRFSVLQSTKIARMYHSSAILLPNGRVLVAGSNPNNGYAFRNVAHPTELRLQAFVPHYMDRQFHDTRPHNVSKQYGHGSMNGVRYGEDFSVVFRLRKVPINNNLVEFTAYAPPFATHSISMNQRMLRLSCKSLVTSEDGSTTAVLEAPPSPNVAPAGYYMLTVVSGGIPSRSSWVRFLPVA